MTSMHIELKNTILEGMKWDALLWNTLNAKVYILGKKYYGSDVKEMMNKKW